MNKLIKKIRKAFAIPCVSNRMELLLDFIYWREKEIHPADANKIVNNYLAERKSNNCG